MDPTTLSAGDVELDSDLDVHALMELIERGCTAGLAARILAPLDTERLAC